LTLFYDSFESFGLLIRFDLWLSVVVVVRNICMNRERRYVWGTEINNQSLLYEWEQMKIWNHHNKQTGGD